MNGRNDEFLDTLSIYTAILQIITVAQTSNDSSNHEIMQELHTQDKKYFEKIIEQNNRILSILEGKSPDTSDK